MQSPRLKDWGVYVYYAADVPSAAMRSAAKRCLQELADVGSNDKVGITALIDLTDAPTRWFVMPPQNKGGSQRRPKPVREESNINSASTAAIREFFDWSVKSCPAKKIALVFWGHGYAIDDFDPRLPNGPIQSHAPEFRFPGDKDPELGSLATSQDENPATNIRANYFAQSRQMPLKLLFDSTHDAVLNNDQVADVIRDCNQKLPRTKKLAVLGFDCCNMAMAEVLCEMEGCAQLSVAAETALPFTSWVSENMLRRLLHSSPPDPKTFATTAVQGFIESFAHNRSIFVALSASDLTLCKDLESAVKSLATELMKVVGDPAGRAAIFKSRNDCPSYDPDGFLDFDCFCGYLEQDMPGTPVSEACALVRRALKSFVIASAFSPDRPDLRISLSRGLSIWFPPWIENPAVVIPQKEQSIQYLYEGYRRTRFARNTGWDKFLLKLVNETHGRGN
jgi:hypothetical protein